MSTQSSNKQCLTCNKSGNNVRRMYCVSSPHVISCLNDYFKTNIVAHNLVCDKCINTAKYHYKKNNNF